MALQIYPDHDSLSLHVANEIAAQIRAKPDSVLCLAAGDTPRLAYQLLSDIVHTEHVDCSACTFVGLDEWMGIPRETEGSCYYFLNSNLFKPLAISQSRISVFDALTKEPDAECQRMDAFIRQHGGIDLMVVGVGMNGHIGFNEPGAPADLYSHVVDLDETTQSVGQKYFKENTRLRQGITLGLKHLLESQRAIMVASGEKKASIISKALQGSIDTSVPASIIRKHPNGVTMLDESAAARLTIL